MHITKDDDWRRRFDPDRPTGAELTLCSIGKFSSAVADAKAEALAMFAEHDAALAKLSERIAELETEKPVARRAVREA